MENNILELDGIFKNGYGFIAKSVMQDNQLSLQAKGLYGYLCSYSGKGKDVFPSRKKMCFDLNISNDTLGKYLKELKESNYIQIIQSKSDGRFSNNIYKINLKLPCAKILDTENLDTNNNNINNNKLINKKEKKEKSKTDIDLVIAESNYSDDLKNMIYEFIKMRKTIKKPMTTIAVKRLINKLDKLSNDEKEKIFILDKSIFNSWQDIYPLKSEDKEEIKDKHEEYEHELTYTADDFTPEQYDRLVRRQMSKEEMIQILKEKKNV